MKRLIYLSYGAAAYLVFLAGVVYAIGFTGNLFLAKSIDSAQRVSLPVAIITDFSLLFLFILQFIIMASPSFKQRWNKRVPPPIERSSFILVGSISFLLLMTLWQPIGGTIWMITSLAGKGFLSFFFFLGWSLVFISTFLINHFDLFGLRQVWRHYKGLPHEQLYFRKSLFYRFVRHPMYFGLLLACWCVPVMTSSHLLVAIMCTGYVIAAIQYEEKDLTSVFGGLIISFGKKKVS
jgi:protein-S-isoprenylcysteine O-methyltransferase Ste14